MTKIIDTLEEKGLVNRNGSQEDRRSTPIQLTLEGANCVKQDIQQGDIWIRKATDVLNDTEKEMFVNMVDRVYKRISEIIDDMESNNK
jgi:DNA-binding MarR family transcriptional regulator